MTDNNELDSTIERDPEVVKRELRIQRDVIAAVVHGVSNDGGLGFGDSIIELNDADATVMEIAPTLLWALQRVTHPLNGVKVLQDQLGLLAVWLK